MSRYDGLIIPRSYSEYINKTDAATLSQALQLSGVMDNAPTSGSNKPAKSGGIYAALTEHESFNPTLLIEGASFNYRKTERKNGIVYLCCNIAMPTYTFGINTNIMTLPENARPQTLIQAEAMLQKSTTITPVKLSIRADGSVAITFSGGVFETPYSISFSIAYPTF